MYPTISDFLLDFFGVNLPLPIQTFGFMLAISFLLAATTLKRELMRKEIFNFWISLSQIFTDFLKREKYFDAQTCLELGLIDEIATHG